MILLRPLLRSATTNDSLRIQELLQLTGLWVDGLDWSELQGWFVAEHKSVVIGALQVLMGKPLGVILYIVVDPEYHSSGVGLALTHLAEHLLAINGSDGTLGFSNAPEFINMAERRNYIETGDEFKVFIRRNWRGRKDENKDIQ